MKKSLIFILSFSTICSIVAQNYMAKRNIQFGTSLTYIRETDPINIYGLRQQNLNWTFNIATSITPRIQLGVENMHIFFAELTEPKLVQANLFGIFGQYSILTDKKTRVFLETSLHRGNYCSCDPFPYRKNNLMYYGFGTGLNYYLGKGLILDLGFHNYEIFQKIPRKYNSTKYVVGINYLLNFKNIVRSNG